MSGGRPIAGRLSYLANLATLAALISTFGARRPGHIAWAILMGLLVLIFLIPWLEGSATSEAFDALGLEMPWSLFFGLLVFAGITNYLPTVFAPAALILALGLGVELGELISAENIPDRRALAWSVSPMLIGLGVVRCGADFRRMKPAAPGVASLWAFFHNLWGAVWSLRVAERFSRTAQAAGWDVRLDWMGATTGVGRPWTLRHIEAEATLASLLRRFASEERIASAREGSAPCPDPVPPGQ